MEFLLLTGFAAIAAVIGAFGVYIKAKWLVIPAALYLIFIGFLFLFVDIGLLFILYGLFLLFKCREFELVPVNE